VSGENRLGRDIPELAEALHVHENTVRNLINRGKIRATRVGKRIIVLNSELERFLGSNTTALRVD
jgi:excisionase family DNA binding protein